MCQRPAWSDPSVLPCSSAELDGNAAFRALLGELALQLAGRTDEDEALALLLPEVRHAMRAYYAGRGRALEELLDPASVQLLDRWLSGEIAGWADEWNLLDPTRRGEGSSTRSAVAELLSRIAARLLPDEIATLVRRCLPAQRPRPSHSPCDGPAAVPPRRRRGSMYFDYKSLVEGYFSRAEYASAADELQEYHRKKVELLEQELSFSLSTPELTRRHDAALEPWPDPEHSPQLIAKWLRWVAQMCIERHVRVRSPFPVRLEGRYAPVEALLKARHKPRLDNAMNELREAHCALLEDIVVCLDPQIVQRRVPESRLYELGLPERAPDPLDFT